MKGFKDWSALLCTMQMRVYTPMFLLLLVGSSYGQADTLLFWYWKKEDIKYLTCVDSLCYKG